MPWLKYRTFERECLSHFARGIGLKQGNKIALRCSLARKGLNPPRIPSVTGGYIEKADQHRAQSVYRAKGCHMNITDQQETP